MEKLKEKILYYNFIPTTYRSDASVILQDLCNGFEVVNIGGTTVEINKRPLYPGTVGSVLGDSYSVGGNKGEVFKGRVDISFPAGGVGIVLFTQKVYVADLIRDLQDSI